MKFRNVRKKVQHQEKPKDNRAINEEDHCKMAKNIINQKILISMSSLIKRDKHDEKTMTGRLKRGTTTTTTGKKAIMQINFTKPRTTHMFIKQ
jgi:hypothetical protein